MKVFKLLLVVFFIVQISSIRSQDTLTKRFIPSGQPILRAFANFNTEISEGDMRSAFELDRAYIGYVMDLSPEFSLKINLDVGSPDDVSEFSKIRRYAYFKNANLTYEHKFLKIDFGLIDMRHFKLQEEFWGHRYIEKSFADRFRFGPSADLGMDVVFDIDPRLKIDLTFSNGEGYTNLQRDNILKAGLGIESELFTDFFLRIYSDLMGEEVLESTGVIFAGYRFRKIITAGAEFNWKLNEDYQVNYNRKGYSVYVSGNLPHNLELFGRYDFVKSNIPDDADRPWDLSNDGSSFIGGIQYQPISRVKIALNYRDWYPYAKNLDNISYIYLNLEFRY